MTKLPHSGAGDFAEQFPEAWGAYEALGKACAQSGPLDARTRRLIKLALSVGARSEGAVHSHARQAVDPGTSAEEPRQVAALAITTLGFPAAITGLSWINDMRKGGGVEVTPFHKEFVAVPTGSSESAVLSCIASYVVSPVACCKGLRIP